MTPNKEYIIILMQQNKWTISELARQTGTSKATISRWLSGKRNSGTKLIAGIIKAFPGEPLNKLFFLPEVLLKSNK